MNGMSGRIVATYGPSASDLARSMAEVAEMLERQLTELATHPTIEGSMLVSVNLEGARLAALRLRAAMVREGEPQ